MLAVQTPFADPAPAGGEQIDPDIPLVERTGGGKVSPYEQLVCQPERQIPRVAQQGRPSSTYRTSFRVSRLGRLRARLPKVGAGILGCSLAAVHVCAGSTPVVHSFTLPEAVQYAAAHYPTVRAAMERHNAAQASISLARTGYLPRADALWQTNRATRNNIAGVLLPQSTVPNPSGPVLDSSTDSFWGTGTGLLLAWEPFDFGYRRALVRSAQATEGRTGEQIVLTILDVQTAAADATLTVLATEQTARAARADVDRRSVLARSVNALVNAGLRPGADASRAEAELAAARTQLILAEQNTALAKASFAELLGLAGTEVEVLPGPLLNLPVDRPAGEVSATSHPLAVVEQDRVDEAKARVHVLNRTYVPKFELQGVGYGRGSGADGKGAASPDFNKGLVPDTVNWAAGVTIKFAVLDYFSVHSRLRVEQANERRQEQVLGQTIQTVTARAARAKVRLEAAQQIARNTPVELQAARDAEMQARARFQAGLVTLVDVAEAQRLLVTAEIDDATSRLSIWRALERLFAAQGSLQPLLDLVNSSSTGRTEAK